MEVRIVRLERERHREAARLLADAFAADGDFARFFRVSDIRGRIGWMFASGCATLRSYRSSFLGAMDADRLVGVAVVTEPHRVRDPGLIVRGWNRLRWLHSTLYTGLHASRLMRAYGRAASVLDPVHPYNYVCYLGVRPEDQSAGVGHRLLDAAYELACLKSYCQGVLLHTVNANLAGSLERRRWSVLGAPSAGGITAHSCFRAAPVTRLVR